MKETFGYKDPEVWFEYVKRWKERLEKDIQIIVL